MWIRSFVVSDKLFLYGLLGGNSQEEFFFFFLFICTSYIGYILGYIRPMNIMYIRPTSKWIYMSDIMGCLTFWSRLLHFLDTLTGTIRNQGTNNWRWHLWLVYRDGQEVQRRISFFFFFFKGVGGVQRPQMRALPIRMWGLTFFFFLK